MLREVALIIGTGAGTVRNILWSSLSGLISNQSLIFVRNARKRKTTATANFSPAPIFFEYANVSCCLESDRIILHKAFSHLCKV
jgi:hypothetical protein